jgi:hypothetical protein
VNLKFSSTQCQFFTGSKNPYEIYKPLIVISHLHIIKTYIIRIFPSSFSPCSPSPSWFSIRSPSRASPAQLPQGSHLSNKMDIFLSKVFLQELCNNHPLEYYLLRDMRMTFGPPLDMLFRRKENCRYAKELGVGDTCWLTL